MKSKQIFATAMIACALTCGAYAAGSIPTDEVDEEKILCGSFESFSNPAEVDYFAVVKATPEYAEITKDKIETGTARYFILMSQAGDRAIRVISETADAEGYDLVTQKGYLKSLSKPIKAANITKLVLDLMREES